MHYDLIIIGDTLDSRRAAIRAARNNRLVAIVRTTIEQNDLFDLPVDELDWSNARSWVSLCHQFQNREQNLSTELAGWGIDLIEGEILCRDSSWISILNTSGEVEYLKFDEVRESKVVERRAIPAWLQAEVPRIFPMNRLSELELLPERILIEGSDLSARRAAVVLARLGYSIVLIAETLDDCEWNAESKQLQQESRERGVRIVPQADVLCVQERGETEFEFVLGDGSVVRTEMYVYATEQLFPGPEISWDDENSNYVASDQSEETTLTSAR